MSIRRNTLSLDNRQALFTEAADSAFLVKIGHVDVYIVPQGGRQSGRRLQVYRAGQGEVVPAFFYRDADYQRWAFALVAIGSVELVEMEHAATDPLRAGFLVRAGMRDEVGQGFDDCLVNRYRRIQAMDHGYFVRASRDARETSNKTKELINTVPSGAGGTSKAQGPEPSHLPYRIASGIPKGQVAGLACLSVAAACAAVLTAGFVHREFASTTSGLGVGSGAILACALAIVLLVLGLAFARGILLRSIRSHAQSRVFEEVTQRLFESPETALRRYGRTELVLLAGEAKRVAGHTVDALAAVVSGVVSALLLSAQMAWYSFPLLIAALVTGCFSAGVAYALAKRRRRWDGQVALAATQADSVLGQFLDGVEKVRTAGIEHRATLEYLKHHATRCAAEAGSQRAQYAMRAVHYAIAFAGVLAMCVIARRSGLDDVGAVMACAILCVALSGALRAVAMGCERFASLGRSAKRVDKLLSVQLEAKREGVEIESLKGRIDFEKVSFSYEDDNRLALDRLSLRVDAGESVGIVGRSGCGKSTLLSLILGFELPTSGVVRLDGVDAMTLDVRALRRCISTVLQDDDLIAASIYENVTLAAPGASIEDVRHALQAVGLWEDVSRMPMGVATIVGEGGCSLSGGQRQRILLARALVRKPRILLLDEATSALDGASQEAVRKTLASLDCTKVIVAHRLDAVADCDRVLVMDEGRIVQEMQSSCR